MSCGRKVDSESRLCPYCGQYSQERLVLPSPVQLYEEPIEGWVRALMYIFSLFIPIAGFIVGAIFLTKPSPEHKRVGKICMILALFSIPVYVVLVVLLSFLVVNGF